MGTPRFTPEFKEEAMHQITERGYSVAEVSDRLGVSMHSRCNWLRAIKPDNSTQHARDLLEAKSEILKLRAQLKRTEKERDILKKTARYFAKESD
ncbi:hypothetical protein NUITMVA1_26580 [Aeromonas hydrophila]|nr:hypothetical protein NUITMVA1_26580 [Aeromonas hydrophila]